MSKGPKDTPRPNHSQEALERLGGRARGQDNAEAGSPAQPTRLEPSRELPQPPPISLPQATPLPVTPFSESIQPPPLPIKPSGRTAQPPPLRAKRPARFRRDGPPQPPARTVQPGRPQPPAQTVPPGRAQAFQPGRPQPPAQPAQPGRPKSRPLSPHTVDIPAPAPRGIETRSPSSHLARTSPQPPRAPLDAFDALEQLDASADPNPEPKDALPAWMMPQAAPAGPVDGPSSLVGSPRRTPAPAVGSRAAKQAALARMMDPVGPLASAKNTGTPPPLPRREDLAQKGIGAASPAQARNATLGASLGAARSIGFAGAKAPPAPPVSPGSGLKSGSPYGAEPGPAGASPDGPTPSLGLSNPSRPVPASGPVLADSRLAMPVVPGPSSMVPRLLGVAAVGMLLCGVWYFAWGPSNAERPGTSGVVAAAPAVAAAPSLPAAPQPPTAMVPPAPEVEDPPAELVPPGSPQAADPMLPPSKTEQPDIQPAPPAAPPKAARPRAPRVPRAPKRDSGRPSVSSISGVVIGEATGLRCRSLGTSIAASEHERVNVCFRVRPARGLQQVVVQWKLGGKVVRLSEHELPRGAGPHAMRAFAPLQSAQSGDWTVQIRTPGGQVLASRRFTVGM